MIGCCGTGCGETGCWETGGDTIGGGATGCETCCGETGGAIGGCETDGCETGGGASGSCGGGNGWRRTCGAMSGRPANESKSVSGCAAGGTNGFNAGGTAADRPPRTWSNHAATRAASAGRAAGSFASSRLTSSDSSPGIAWIGGTGSRSTRRIRSPGACPVRRGNGGAPVSIAYSTAPSPYRSDAAERVSSRNVSGAVYSSACMGSRENRSRSASPKSPSTGSPDRRNSTLCGVTPPCTTPASCAAASALDTAAPMPSTSDTGSAPLVNMPASEPAHSCVITLDRSPPYSPTASTVRIDGTAPTVASARRSRSSRVAVSRSNRSGNTFTATSAPVSASRPE